MLYFTHEYDKINFICDTNCKYDLLFYISNRCLIKRNDFIIACMFERKNHKYSDIFNQKLCKQYVLSIILVLFHM